MNVLVIDSLTDVEAHQGWFSLLPSPVNELDCSGTEDNLLECPYSNNNCTAGEKAALFCGCELPNM